MLVRLGLNSGEVVVRAVSSDLRMDYTAVGQTTHLAARMEQLANPGTTLLTADTLRLAEGLIAVKPLGPVPIKGLGMPIEVYELTGAGVASRASTRRPLGALRGSLAGRPSWNSSGRRSLARPLGRANWSPSSGSRASASHVLCGR